MANTVSAALPYVAPAVKAGFGLYQLLKNVKRTDTITDAEREQLALARQAQAAQLPGYGRRLGELARIQAGTIQAAQLGAGSGSDFLAASGAAAERQQQGEQQLGAEGERYHDVATRQLSSVLSAYGAHQRADTNQAAQANAQLQGAGLNNTFSGLNELGSVAAYKDAMKTPSAPGTLPTAPPGVNDEADYNYPYGSRRPTRYGRGYAPPY